MITIILSVIIITVVSGRANKFVIFFRNRDRKYDNKIWCCPIFYNLT